MNVVKLLLALAVSVVSAVLVAVLASRSSAPKVSPAHPAFQGLRALPDPEGPWVQQEWGYRDRQGNPARQAR